MSLKKVGVAAFYVLLFACIATGIYIFLQPEGPTNVPVSHNDEMFQSRIDDLEAEKSEREEEVFILGAFVTAHFDRTYIPIEERATLKQFCPMVRSADFRVNTLLSLCARIGL